MEEAITKFAMYVTLSCNNQTPTHDTQFATAQQANTYMSKHVHARLTLKDIHTITEYICIIYDTTFTTVLRTHFDRPTTIRGLHSSVKARFSLMANSDAEVAGHIKLCLFEPFASLVEICETRSVYETLNFVNL